MLLIICCSVGFSWLIVMYVYERYKGRKNKTNRDVIQSYIDFLFEIKMGSIKTELDYERSRLELLETQMKLIMDLHEECLPKDEQEA